MTQRDRTLLTVLLLLVICAAPVYYLNRILKNQRAEIQRLEQTAAPIRDKADKIKKRQEALAKAPKDASPQFADRFVGSDPAGEIWSELDRVALKSGVALTNVTLQAGQPVKDLAGVVQYPASITAQGSFKAVVAFLRGLEESHYLIEIPELTLTIPGTTPVTTTAPAKAPAPAAPALTVKGTAGKPSTPSVVPSQPEMVLPLNLNFFGQAGK